MRAERKAFPVCAPKGSWSPFTNFKFGIFSKFKGYYINTYLKGYKISPPSRDRTLRPSNFPDKIECSKFPYLTLKMSSQTTFLLVNNLHFHFYKRSILKSLIPLIPRPSFFFSMQIFLQLTYGIFLPSCVPPQKKSLWILSISFQILAGSLNKYRKKIGRDPRTDFTKVSLHP